MVVVVVSLDIAVIETILTILSRTVLDSIIRMGGSFPLILHQSGGVIS